MKNVFRIISKAIFLVCFAIFLSFMVKTEAKAAVIDKFSSPSKPELTNLINVQSSGSGIDRTYRVTLTSDGAIIIDGLGYYFLKLGGNYEKT